MNGTRGEAMYAHARQMEGGNPRMARTAFGCVSLSTYWRAGPMVATRCIAVKLCRATYSALRNLTFKMQNRLRLVATAVRPGCTSHQRLIDDLQPRARLYDHIFSLAPGIRQQEPRETETGPLTTALSTPAATPAPAI